MLSYPDSKELERLGYPQELKRGDWYYEVSEPDEAAVYLGSWAVGERFFYIKVPTTDGMIEGLREEIRCIYPLVKAWAVETYDVVGELDYGGRKESEFDRTTGETVDQALCELWKKVKSVPLSE